MTSRPVAGEPSRPVAGEPPRPATGAASGGTPRPPTGDTPRSVTGDTPRSVTGDTPRSVTGDAPRRVVGDARRWKAMSHPLRREILRHLGEHEAANSTTIAEALGQNTGTTSYHLRVLADAGVIEEIPERSHGRERWWRTIPVDLREPDYDTLSPEERAALDEWRASQIPVELALVNRFIRDVRRHGKWAKASRAGGYYTAEDLDALFEEYIALLHKYGHSAQDAPPGARPMQLRMFYIPDESGEQEDRT